MGDYKAYAKDWDVRELDMPIDVIVHEYRLAKNKSRMIDVLAEQNSTKPCRIAWILNRCGLEVDPKKMPRALRNEGSFDYVAHWEISTDAAVCERIRKQLEENLIMPNTENHEGVVEEAMGHEEIPADECMENTGETLQFKPLITSGEIVAEFWSTYLRNRKSNGDLTKKDVNLMLELEHIALEMVYDE